MLKRQSVQAAFSEKVGNILAVYFSAKRSVNRNSLIMIDNIF